MTRSRHATPRVARILQALPPYLGGKRKLLGPIFRALPRPSEAPVLVDAFLGGGSVSLMAKRRGVQVRCNDIALRSAIIGRGLVANDTVTLAPEDIHQLFTGDTGDAPGFIERELAGTVLTTPHARFLDQAVPVALRRGGVKGALLLLVVVRYVIALRPMGNFGAKTVIEQIERGDWDDVTPSVLRDAFVKRMLSHPARLCDELRRKINAGVFGSGQRHESYQEDVFDFLGHVEGSVAYLDPPYGGTAAYETALRPLDSILAGRAVDAVPSAFSGKLASETLDRLLEACGHIPRLVLSYGNAVLTPDQIHEAVRRHRRDVRMEVIAYQHLKGLANEDTREKNREILISAGGKR